MDIRKRVQSLPAILTTFLVCHCSGNAPKLCRGIEPRLDTIGSCKEREPGEIRIVTTVGLRRTRRKDNTHGRLLFSTTAPVRKFYPVPGHTLGEVLSNRLL